ncbi:MAG: hypothetical protein AAGE80_16025 [Pseudomonadota bacterium]
MGKIALGVGTAVISAVTLSMLGLNNSGDMILNVDGGGGSGGGYRTSEYQRPQYSSLCYTAQGSCQVQPMPRGSSCGCYNAYGQAFFGEVR